MYGGCTMGRVASVSLRFTAPTCPPAYFYGIIRHISIVLFKTIKRIIFHVWSSHTNYYYFIQDWISQIIIISYKIGSLKLFLFHTRLDHTDCLIFMHDLIARIIISYKIWSHRLFNFHARFDHTNYYYFMQDWITQINIVSYKIWSHK
jgi:hypothetical protein